MTIDKRIRFDETYVNEECGTTTHYFTIEKSLLEEIFPNKYPEAYCGEIWVEFPTDCIDAREAYVAVSPTEYDEENDGYTDYDWNDLSISYAEIEALLNLVEI